MRFGRHLGASASSRAASIDASHASRCCSADGERRVAHAQAGMALLRAVLGRTAPVLAEEQREGALPGCEVLGIERPEDGIALDARVEGSTSAVEERLTADELEHGDLDHDR